MFATNAQINLTVAFIGTNALECPPLMAQNGLFAKIAQINLAVAFSGTNVLECLIKTIDGLEWFVCNKCTN